MNMRKLNQGYFIVKIFLLLFVLRLNDCTEYSLRVTNYGKVRGVVEEVHGQKKVEKFFGIPYASPPLGNLRLEVSDNCVTSV
jgi:hypothetical protein